MKRNNAEICVVFLGICMVLGVLASNLCASGVAQPPDEVRISFLSDIYEPVLFDHALHDGYASCVECHHHVIVDPPSDPVCLPCHNEGKELAAVGCSDCHPVDRYAAQQNPANKLIYHNDTPGLIGAYHRNCISCHRVIGTGPVGCEECHAKKP